MECNFCNKDETRPSFDYEVVKIKHTKDYNLLSHEDALKKFRYLFFELERMRLKRYILLEKINNVVEQSRYYEHDEIATYYSASFSKVYFGSVVRLSGRDVSRLADIENFKKDFESKNRLMLEKIRPASDFIDQLKKEIGFQIKEVIMV